MSKIVWILGLLLAFFVSPSSATLVSVDLTDSSFESWNGTNDLVQWVETGTITSYTSSSVDGSSSVRIDAGSSVSQSVSLPSRSSYVIFYVYANREWLDCGHFNVVFDFYGSDGYISTSSVSHLSSAPPYNLYSSNVTVPSGAEYLTVSIVNAETYEGLGIYFDYSSMYAEVSDVSTDWVYNYTDRTFDIDSNTTQISNPGDIAIIYLLEIIAFCSMFNVLAKLFSWVTNDPGEKK